MHAHIANIDKKKHKRKKSKSRAAKRAKVGKCREKVMSQQNGQEKQLKRTNELPKRLQFDFSFRLVFPRPLCKLTYNCKMRAPAI